MTFNYRMGAVVTFAREDGQPGPGEKREYKANEGWNVEILDEGAVEISGYGRRPVPPSTIVPWHRIWEVTAIPMPLADRRSTASAASVLPVGAHSVVDAQPLGSPRICVEQSCDLTGQRTEKLRCPSCDNFTQFA
jgi:hypothetical protein